MVVAVPTFQDGVMANAAELNALVANVSNLYTEQMGGVGSFYVASKPQLICRVTASRACGAANVETAVIWDTADSNSDSMWTSGATITVHTTGTYRLSAQVGSDGAFGDGMALYLCVNGTVTATNAVGCWRESRCTQGRVTATVSLTVGATIVVIMQRFAGSGRNYLLNTGGCRFEAIRIGPA